MPDSLISPDGKSYWDGQRWVPMQQSGQPAVQPAQQPVIQPSQLPVYQALQPAAPVQQHFSDDRLWWWNGTDWVPASQAPAPPPPPQWAATPSAGQAPPAMMAPAAIAMGGVGLMSQFSGTAAWSIGIGVASIVAPLFAGFYFRVFPILGVIYAVRAFRRGQVIGGAVGIVLNILGGISSLIASGLLFH